MSVRRIQKVIQNEPPQKYTEHPRHPLLTQYHVEERLKWSEKYITWIEQWKSVVFSYEEKFDLDGLNGFSYYWHDIRKEPQYPTSKNHEDCSLIVWAIFSSCGEKECAIQHAPQTSTRYVYTLNNFLITFSDHQHGKVRVQAR